MDSTPLVLASGSPRRLQLMTSLGLECEVVPVDIDETPLPGESPVSCAIRLATGKAAAAVLRHAPAKLVIAADTVVTLGEEMLGKPVGPADAARMLRRLSGRTHQVHTGVAASRAGTTSVRLSSSDVTFRALEAREIEAYVATGEPLDKAGAYGIQGLAAVFVSSLRGSYSGVVGLPLYETAELLAGFGIDVLAATRERQA